MSAQLAVRKRLLTIAVNKLQCVVSEVRDQKLEEISFNSTTSHETKVAEISKLEGAIITIDVAVEKVEKTLFELAANMDDQETSNNGEQESFELYSERAELALSEALDQTFALKARRQALAVATSPHSEQTVISGSTQQSRETLIAAENQIHSPAVELPPLPIPSFEGNIWEWDNFWEIFDNNINSKDLPEMVKYNYLLDALKGEARESVLKFRVSKDNYTKAITYLLNKYNNKEALVNHLVEQLEDCTLRNPSIREQRSLLEKLQAITTQLEDKGENINSTWIIKRVLAKFPDSTKRKVINKKQGLTPNEQFNMGHVFKFIDEILSTEETFLVFADKSLNAPKERTVHGKAKFSQSMGSKCMYCKGNHSSINCTRHVTPQDRSSYLRENKLCLICASPDHISTQCKGRLCFNCNGPHHTSCCFKIKQQLSSNSPNKNALENNPESGNSKTTLRKKADFKGKLGKVPHNNIRSNTIITGEELNNTSQEITPPTTQSVLSAQSSPHTCLPTAEVTVMDPDTKSLLRVEVLFDTGAEVSFIDDNLAKKLRLPILDEKMIKISTFGTKKVDERKSQRVQMDVWDNEGNPHTLVLFTHTILTQSFAPTSLTIQDQEFLHERESPIYVQQRKGNIKPLILLGCDLLWSFVRTDKPPFSLPSGLHVLPTKLGYVICGKANASEEGILQVSQYKMNDLPWHTLDDLEQWEQYWSMNSTRVYTISKSDSGITQEEREQWEQYWSMDAAATEEFLGPEKEAQTESDKRVWDQFNKSIEKREDGYYVRLPWKEKYPYLPDNRALAYQRLINVWNSLKKDEQLLDQYNDVFQDQLRKNIVEPVDEDGPTEGTQIHYIPHQPVLTPQKTTTKLRIVFDASAHYKGSPSLNDVLHRGPVILPSLYGLLLRFRIGQIALISDVEKAFLQVRLHETDRDATRCLWLIDHKKPPSINNIRTLRFTRVTFGLKSSPFLLAGTTYYHLDKHKEEDLVQEIKNNLYVDNILITSDTCEEALKFYSRSKAIFTELKMNLREFNSNSTMVMEKIPEADKSANHCPKVLGIEWDSKTDSLVARCSMKEFGILNKRTITSAIATVYDPMGWLIPLLHRAKVFLQTLWKDQYKWDTPLSKEKVEEWDKISSNLRGFYKIVPRFLVPKMAEIELVIFADASISGMTACAYLHYAKKAHLLMAKSKLPSIHGKTTIPKLEMNAITLAARLANAIVTQLNSILNIREIYILSDSEVALHWLKCPPSREWGTFVYNRLFEIRKILDHLKGKGHVVRFGHVSSKDNPADCGTRGLSKEEFKEHFWWTGPTWHQADTIQWPIRNTVFECVTSNQDDEQNLKTDLVTTTGVAAYDPELLQQGRVKTFSQAKRIIAYALRFVRSTIAKINRKGIIKIRSGIPDIPSEVDSSSLCGSEVEYASKVIIIAHQTLKVTTHILKTLKDLNIHKDKEGVLRCYGRLGRAQLEFSAKYPAFVLQKTVLADIIIRDIHQQNHTGINHTISLVRQQFWIPQLRSQVQYLIRRCIKCQKFNNLPYKYPQQEDLPKERVIQSRPFQHVGLDYFGPLSIKSESGNQGKCYGAIVTCMVTRLLHLDVVSDLSTVAFLHMLRRFFARRGVPQTIISDNAPTFLLGEEILRKGLEEAQRDPLIAKELSNRGIDWKHITPYAPWQGGFYERMIKSIKHSLHKTLGRSIVSFEELSTAIIEIEAIINTRPLTYETTDMDREQVVRPIDFLQKDICLSYPIPSSMSEDPDYILPEEKLAIQTKSQAIAALQTSNKLTEKFWNVWKNQYIISLREKHMLNVGVKKGCAKEPLEGAIVLVSEAATPRHAWKMGRIQKLVMNAKGTIREALIRLPSHRQIRRPINLLVPLELEDDSLNKQENSHIHVEENPNANDSGTAEVPGSNQFQSRSDSRGQSPASVTRYNLRSRQRSQYGDDWNKQYPMLPHTNFLSTIAQVLVVTILAFSISEASTPSSMNKPLSLRIIQFGPSGVFGGQLTSSIFLRCTQCSSISDTMLVVPWSTKPSAYPVPPICGLIITSRVFMLGLISVAVTLKTFINPNQLSYHLSLQITMEEENVFVKEFRFLSEVCEKSLSDGKLEDTMRETLMEIHRHIKVAKTVDVSLTHHLIAHTCSDETGGELAITTSRLLNTATVTIGNLKRTMQKYMYLDAIYALLTNVGVFTRSKRKGWLEGHRCNHDTNTKDIILLVQRHLTVLERHVEDLEHEIEKSVDMIRKEKVVLKGLTFNNFNNNDEVNNILQKMEKHLAAIAGNTEERNAAKQQQQVAERPTNTDKNNVISDDDYLDNLIKETSEECNNGHLQTQEEEVQPSLEQKRRRLEKDLDELRRGLRLLPRRKIGDSPQDVDPLLKCAFCRRQGMHFSDSCRDYTTLKERQILVNEDRRCRYCLKVCGSGENCKSKNNECWYCEIVRDTVLGFLIPRREHHRALCPIPDSKDRIREAIADVRNQLERVERMEHN